MNTRKKLIFEARKHYGRWLYFPQNELAQQYCDFADRRRGNSINSYQLTKLREIGIQMQITGQVPDADA